MKKTLLLYAIVIVAVIGLGFFLFQQSNKPRAELPGQAFEIVGAEHLPGCTPSYNSNPPTSGCHDPQPATWGVHNEGKDEVFIHNLEHGGIWISYKPELDPAQIEQLKDFAKRYRKIIVAPRAQNDANIALVSWGRLQNLDQYDETAILRFIEANYNKAPEPGAP